MVGSSLLLSLTQLPPTATVTFIELSLTKSQSFMLIGSYWISIQFFWLRRSKTSCICIHCPLVKAKSQKKKDIKKAVGPWTQRFLIFGSCFSHKEMFILHQITFIFIYILFTFILFFMSVIELC